MQQFRPDVEAFVRRSRRRISYEIAFLSILLLFFISPLSHGVPELLQWSTFGGVTLYIVFGLAMYPNSKNTVERFSISLLENALTYTTGDLVRSIPYKDLQISSVKKHLDSVTAVRLRMAFGQSITIRDLKEMDEFYKRLCSHLE